MLIYDKAHELADEIRKSEEFMTYSRLREQVMADEKTRMLIGDYKKLQLEAQAAYLSGSTPSEETMEKIKQLGGLLAFNKDVAEYLAAEYRLQTIVGDVYKIIGDACGLGLDFLSE
ncbi:MAG: YlbF family regulator [Christensenellaceae bacterium]|nr:YlbF family regulator [Christensenellaceae bacterium]